MDSDRNISAEDVIAKLKDDGDFDRLRLQIIRKLKDNEDLRSNIVSMVKQSAALNQPNAENMKPRQLSDAIYGEIGNEAKSKISDGLWEIIQSGDGMKSEITETVQSVYNKLLNPKGKEEAGSSPPQNAITTQKVAENCSVPVLSSNVDELLLDNEPNEPPGFTLIDQHHDNNVEGQHKGVLQLPLPNEREPIMEKKEGPHHLEDGMNLCNADSNKVPSIFPGVEERQSCGVSDDDPDVPPGFG